MKRCRARAKKKQEKEKARREIVSLFEQADALYPDVMAHRYVRKARRLAMKYRLRLPRAWKRRYCRHCYAFLKPGSNARIRTRDGKLIITCFECHKHWRMPLS